MKVKLQLRLIVLSEILDLEFKVEKEDTISNRGDIKELKNGTLSTAHIIGKLFTNYDYWFRI